MRVQATVEPGPDPSPELDGAGSAAFLAKQLRWHVGYRGRSDFSSMVTAPDHSVIVVFSGPNSVSIRLRNINVVAINTTQNSDRRKFLADVIAAAKRARSLMLDSVRTAASTADFQRLVFTHLRSVHPDAHMYFDQMKTSMADWTEFYEDQHQARATVEPGTKAFIEHAVAMHQFWNHLTWSEKGAVERPVLGDRHVEVTTLVQRGQAITSNTTVLLTIDRPGTGFTVNLTWFPTRTITARIMLKGRVLAWDEHAERDVRTSNIPKSMLESAFKYYLAQEARYTGEVVATVEPQELNQEQVAKLLAQGIGFKVVSGRRAFGNEVLVVPHNADVNRMLDIPFNFGVYKPMSGRGYMNIAIDVFGRCVKSDSIETSAGARDLIAKSVDAAKKLDAIIKAALRKPNPAEFKEYVHKQAEAQIPGLEFGWPLGNGAMDYYDEQTGYRTGGRVHATVEPETEFAKELQEFKSFAIRLGFQGFKVKQHLDVGPVLVADHTSQPVALKFYHGEDHVHATAQLEILGQAQLAVTWDSQAQKDFLAGRVRKAIDDIEAARSAARDPMELHKLVKRFAVHVKPSVVQKFLQSAGGRA